MTAGPGGHTHYSTRGPPDPAVTEHPHRYVSGSGPYPRRGPGRPAGSVPPRTGNGSPLDVQRSGGSPFPATSMNSLPIPDRPSQDCPRCRLPVDALAPNSHGGRQCPRCYTVLGMPGGKAFGRRSGLGEATTTLANQRRHSGYACIACGRPVPNYRNLTMCFRCQDALRQRRQQHVPAPRSPLGRAIRSSRRDAAQSPDATPRDYDYDRAVRRLRRTLRRQASDEKT